MLGRRVSRAPGAILPATNGSMGLLGAIRATGSSPDDASSKRNGAVRAADDVGERIGGSPLIELTPTWYEPDSGRG